MDGNTLVELRSTGGQTILSPSLHEDTGELIAWENWGPPTPVAYADLLAAVKQLGMQKRGLVTDDEFRSLVDEH